MNLFLSFQGGTRPAEVSYAKTSDVAGIRQWNVRTRGQTDAMTADSVELGTLACKWWRYYRRKGEFANSLNELHRVLRRRANAEVSMMFVVRASWADERGILGACHFRRTWAGNIAVDFLATNPAKLGVVGGVGRALLHEVALLADTLGAARIWGECTPRSHDFYRHIFPRCELADTFVVSRPDYQRFIRECGRRQRERFSK